MRMAPGWIVTALVVVGIAGGIGHITEKRAKIDQICSDIEAELGLDENRLLGNETWKQNCLFGRE